MRCVVSVSPCMCWICNLCIIQKCIRLEQCVASASAMCSVHNFVDAVKGEESTVDNFGPLRDL